MTPREAPLEGSTYRITSPTLAMDGSPCDQSQVTLPKDAVLTVLEVKDSEFIHIVWDNRELTMFSVDLVERGELVD